MLLNGRVCVEVSNQQHERHKDKLGKWVRQPKVHGKVFSNSLVKCKGGIKHIRKLAIYAVQFVCFNVSSI